MKKDYKALADNVGSSVQELASEIPKVICGFEELSGSVKAEAAFLDEKTIRLIGLAVAVSMHCEPCISAHARSLAELKAQRHEIAEAVSICIKMGGAPSLTYAADALRAYDLFKESEG
jgi:AhpD family alkylhydroperoxidase